MDIDLDLIWQHTPKFRTAGHEIATLWDLGDGVEKIGFVKDKNNWDVCPPEFLVIRRDQLEAVLQRLSSYGRFGRSYISYRICCEAYEDLSLGVHPSSLLSDKDLSVNPQLLMLLIGEIDNDSYYSGLIACHGPAIMVGHRQIKGLAQPSWSMDTAESIAKRYAARISALSDLAARNENDYMRSFFTAEKEIGGKLGITYEHPYLQVGTDAMFEVGTIPYAQLRIRSLEIRLTTDDLSMTAKAAIQNIIKSDRQKIAANEGTYFPCFWMTNQ